MLDVVTALKCCFISISSHLPWDGNFLLYWDLKCDPTALGSASKEYSLCYTIEA